MALVLVCACFFVCFRAGGFVYFLLFKIFLIFFFRGCMCLLYVYMQLFFCNNTLQLCTSLYTDHLTLPVCDNKW